MSSPLLRWSVLAFACLWFGMLLPVHQRGQIQLPGPGGSVACDRAGCGKSAAPVPACHKKKACDHAAHPGASQGDTKGGEKKPAKTGNCAVCHFIAGLHAPPPATIYVQYLGLLESRPVDDHFTAPLRHAAMPFHGLDPPTA